MTTQAFSTKLKNTTISHSMFAVPLLNRIRQESREEYDDMQQAFALMGWRDLPDELKMEIYNDVKCMVQELKGLYCSADPHVDRRRETVHYWVTCYMDGICSLEAAVRALKIKSL